MSDEGAIGRFGVAALLAGVARGEEDPRLRATWRVLLALALFVVSTLAVVATVEGLASLGVALSQVERAAFGIPLGAAVFFALLVPWARYVDRRPLAAYGFERSRRWVADLGVGFLAVAVGLAAWYGVGTALGWTTVEPAWSYDDGRVGPWVAVMAVVWGLSGAQQATLYFGLWLRNAAEGLAARGVAPRRAVVGAWAVAAALFALRHGPADVASAVPLAAGGLVFGALYVHTGDLALPIGAVGWGNFVNFVLFAPADSPVGAPAVFEVTQSLPPGLEPLSDPRLPQLLVAYAVAAAWVSRRRGGLGIDASIAEWTER